ncbi:RING [Nesidiocoris tenuis]|uniref:E3 ubiquitin-protein ligase listerin n=1 Tax=Nesidiocoris tenuis TaxID=355587 RepID=A0ABN7ACD2_9HEMI|nr:RING [Nesidiocoris tenuis]
MGGKKQAQRTKNNAKPSSSGRTAELLSSSTSQFGGLTTLKGTHFTNSSTSTPTFDVFNSQLDPNIVVVLKKLSKKDAITRFKALNELAALVKDLENESDIVELLPSWAKLYSNLVVDVDHKVREATQCAHKAIAVRVGRNMAPFVKQIVPSWFISQCDTHPPAASAAALAFKEAFPPHKITGVIVFCQREIVKYISDNLLLENTSPKNDEAEAKFERIVVACLNGYALYLSRIPSSDLAVTLEENMKIISSPLFWKHQKHKSRNIRAAFFSLVTSLLKNAPQLLANEHSRLTKTILSTIDDYDPVVLPTVWESVLHLVTTVPDCWQHVNLEKFVLNKICSIIGHGGQGNAHLIFPNILLFLSKIPSDIIKSKQQFFSRIFASFQQGMKQQCVLQSHSECDAIAASFHECVRYIIMQYADTEDLCSCIVKDHLLPSYTNLMLEPANKHLVLPYYSAFIQNLLYWQKNCHPNDEYARHLDTICDSLPSINLRNLNKYCEDRVKIAFILDCQIKFVSSINRPSTKKKKRLKVQFSIEDDSKPSDSLTEVSQTEDVTDPHEEALRSRLYKLIDELMRKYFTIASTHESAEVQAMYVEQLSQFTSVLTSEQLRQLSGSHSKDLYQTLTKWLSSDCIPVRCTLSLVFNTIENVDEEERQAMLVQLTEIRPDESVLEVIKMASQEMSGKKTFKKWLESETVKIEVIKILTERITSDGNFFHLLEMCWSTYKSGEPVLGKETVSSVLDTVSDHIESGSIRQTSIVELFDSLLVPRNRFIVKLCSSKIRSLLKTLLGVALINGDPDLVASWKSAVKFMTSLQTESEDSWLKESMAVVIDRIICSDGPGVSSLYKAAELMYSLVVASVELNGDSTNIALIPVTCALDENWKTLFERIQRLVTEADYVKGNILRQDACSIPYRDALSEGKWDPLADLDLGKFARTLAFCVKYLSHGYGAEVSEDLEISEYDAPRAKISADLAPAHLLAEFSVSLFVCERSVQYFNAVRQCKDMKELNVSIKATMKELVQLLKPDEQYELLELCKNRSLQNPGQPSWKRASAMIRHEFLDQDQQVNCFDLPDQLSITEEFLHQVRLNCSNLEYLGRVLAAVDQSRALLITSQKGSSPPGREELRLNSELGRFVAVLIEKYPDVINEKGWDFIMISLASWFTAIPTIEIGECYLEFVQFVTSACELLVVFVQQLVESVTGNREYLKYLFEEWNKLFADDTYAVLCDCWEKLAEQTLATNMNSVGLLHLNSLCEAICRLCKIGDACVSFVGQRNADKFMTSWTKTIISPHIPVQITSYYLLTNAIPNLVKKDSNFDENSLDKLSFQKCASIFSTAQNLVSALLGDFNIGVSCAVSPYTDSYTYTLAYLMLWSWLLEMCRSSDSQLRYVYTLWIKEQHLFPPIMESIFKLMPESVLRLGEANIKKKQEFFTARPSFSFGDWTSEKLSHFSCWLYCEILRALPAVARQWTAEADPKFLSFVDNLTSTFVSPVLCNEEMMSIKDEQKAFDNVEVQTHRAVREVIAVYTVEETSTELVIKLAANHPLSPPKVEISKTIKISSNQNRQLLMQLTIFLTHQNGSIYDGLLLWKSNLDKKFEGVEECYICFSIVHNSSHQLPKMTCQTCKKKFHSFCLYKWFTTSNKSTCPICRNHF